MIENSWLPRGLAHAWGDASVTAHGPISMDGLCAWRPLLCRMLPHGRGCGDVRGQPACQEVAGPGRGGRPIEHRAKRGYRWP